MPTGEKVITWMGRKISELTDTEVREAFYKLAQMYLRDRESHKREFEMMKDLRRHV